MALLFQAALCSLLVHLVHCVVRSGVQVYGPTLPPGFKRNEGRFAASCPRTHPYPHGNFTLCCSSKNRDLTGTCPSDGGDDLLLGADPEVCCPQEQSVSCGRTPCKMHIKGYERQSTQALLLGRHGTYIWKFNPKDTTYPTPKRQWPMQEENPLYMTPAGATEYPAGSGRVVVCGGFLQGYSVVRNCSQYDFSHDSWSAFPELLSTRGESFMFTTASGTLWVIGGTSYDSTNYFHYSDTTEYFHESSKSWRYGHALPEKMARFGAAYLSGSKVFLAGGYHQEVDGLSKSVYIFDVETGLYKRMADLPREMGPFALGKLTLPGGDLALVATANGVEYKTMSDTQTVRIYAMANDTWNVNADWDHPGLKRYIDMQRMVSVDNQLYLFSGTHTNNGLDLSGRIYRRDVWRFDGPDAMPVWTKIGELPRDDHIDVAVLVTLVEPY